MPIDIVGGSTGLDSQAYVDTIKRKCKKSDYANFVGQVSHKEKIKYLQNARCVIFPVMKFYGQERGKTNIWIEPGCMIPLEANACGTPIIASPNGFIGEVISEGINGFLSNTIDEFIDKIKKIESVDSEMCRCRAEYFSDKYMVENYLNTYEKIINGYKWN